MILQNYLFHSEKNLIHCINSTWISYQFLLIVQSLKIPKNVTKKTDELVYQFISHPNIHNMLKSAFYSLNYIIYKLGFTKTISFKIN